tara:strand:- start:365 stop:553 length:189 start_codon:yes stop_codon:yes gene_type:complete
MAKKQTFGEKVGQSKKSAKNNIKLIRSGRSDKGTLRFSEEMVQVPDGKNADGYVKEILSKGD